MVLGHVSQLTEKPWNYRVAYEQTLKDFHETRAKFMSSPQKWEYTTYSNNKEIKPIRDMLSEHGRDGWELVAITPETGSKYETYYFKRPLVEGK